MSLRYPFLRPNPPRLSALVDELRDIENSGIYSNYGPVNSAFEADVTAQLFGGRGGCLTVCNATIGLMIAIRHVVARQFGGADFRPPAQRRYALMPAFTFAATAHAALWNGLTPLLCDINAETWLPSAAAEEELLDRHGDEIAVMVPYATFGNCLPLDRYRLLAERHGIPIVVDAAASLGALADDGGHFGTGFPFPVVFSMHATKTYAAGEGGLIHCGEQCSLEALRAMGNFGFGEARLATMPGLNAKLTEVGALVAQAKLTDFEAVVLHREVLAECYRRELPGLTFQRPAGRRHPHQFMPALLPADLARDRDALLHELTARGVGARTYFSPHLGEQPYFAATSVAGDLAVTRDIAQRVISLPLHDGMGESHVVAICAILNDLLEHRNV